MAGKRGGIHSYTVQEAQNAAMGQAGSVFLDTASTDFIPTNGVVVAITMITDCAFEFLTGEGGDGSGTYINRIGDGYESQGDALGSGDSFPAGMTIYGRWTTVSVQTSGQKCICYVG